MAKYKPVERGGIPVIPVIPVILEDEIQPGTFEFALDHLVDHELDLAALDARFANDEVGASAYDLRVMLEIILLGYSRGLISSRKIAQACEHNIVFIALSGDNRPSFSHIALCARARQRHQRPLRPSPRDAGPHGPHRAATAWSASSCPRAWT